ELAARVRLDGAVVAESAAGAAAEPVLIALDNAEGVGDLPKKGAVCVVLASSRRSPGLDAIAERVGRDVPGVVLRTEPFAEGDVTDLVRWAFPSFKKAESERLVRRVLADTAGNPFLATELVLAVKGGLKLPEKSRAWPAAHRTLDDTLPADLPE